MRNKNPFIFQGLQGGIKPSINQLQQQQQQNLYPSLFNNATNNNFMNNNTTGQLAQPLIVPPRAGLEIANGGVLMPMLNPQSMNNNTNTNNMLNNMNSTNPFLAM